MSFSASHKKYIEQIREWIRTGVKQNRKQSEKFASGLGIHDKTEIKELTELAIVLEARNISRSGDSEYERFQKIVNLYNSQINLSHRTSQSMLLQQYSTPAPIGFLAGIFCGVDKFGEQGKIAFEPSAGNGLLTIAAAPPVFIVNEIDTLRNAHLKIQPFSKVTKLDATEDFSEYQKKFDAVITNPPFGRLAGAVKLHGYKIKSLEHLMAIKALDAMKDKGRAAIIIGGHTRYDQKGRVQEGGGRFFLNFLYKHFNVCDIIPISGQELYSRQGTSFDTRLILLSGRKAIPEGAAPLYNEEAETPVKDFLILYDRVKIAVKKAEQIEKGFSERNENKEENKMDEFEKAERELEEEIRRMRANENLQGTENVLKANPEEEVALSRYFYHKTKTPEIIFLYSVGSDYIALEKDAQRIHEVMNFTLRRKKFYEGVYKVVYVPVELADIVIARLKSAKHSIGIMDDLEISKIKYRNPKTLTGIYGKENSDELGAPYLPASEGCVVLNTVTPDSMDFETRSALAFIKKEVGGDIDEFVRQRLKYSSKIDLCKALSAEQTDAVAMAIYNIEAREQGMIIGDQTGIGKGRIAAAMIRYAVNQGLKPMFITEKPNLFSDIYRDLIAIGSGHLVPFIINGRESKTDIKDANGELLFQAFPYPEQKSIFESGKIPATCDFALGTYSQFNSPDKKPEKPAFLNSIAAENIFILDESHNASGSSKVGFFLQSVLSQTKGVVFLSATFAKRPDNMPIYAMKTAIVDANMTRDELVMAVQNGGVALQEILSSQLVKEGQMLRRERSFEGVEVNYNIMEDDEPEHRAIADNITEILRDIIAFQDKYVMKQVDKMDDAAKARGEAIRERGGTSQAGVDSPPYFSKIFNVINQMLFAIKAEAVAEKTILRLKEGKKVVIAFSSTMGSFIEQMENASGLPVSDGDLISTDFSLVLLRGLEGVMRYTVTKDNGEKDLKEFNKTELGENAIEEYERIFLKIKELTSGICISPIDLILEKIKAAGFSAHEVTGRKYEVRLNKNATSGVVEKRDRINTNDAFRQFNNNEVDVLMINQSGSTGASAHAIVTDKVKANQVKQRVMIVLQPELDINTEVQKRGRINRTGQILQPIYDYEMSAIPAEKRLLMMLQKKLKSLDANTASNQKQSTKILDVPDFLNKYGDKVVTQYLQENKEVNKLLGDPLFMDEKGENENPEILEGAALKVSGRVAVLSTLMQDSFYQDVSASYNEYVEYLKQIGDYDLEVEALNLQSETLETSVSRMGKGGDSEFGADSILEKVMANVLKKPFKKTELENLLKESLNGKKAEAIQENQIAEYESFYEGWKNKELADIQKIYDDLIKEIPNENKAIKAKEKSYDDFIKYTIDREKELKESLVMELENNTKKLEAKKDYVLSLLNFFSVGRNLMYAGTDFGEGAIKIPAVFIGFMIDKKKKNPYAPSNIKLRFAIANSIKYLALPASYQNDIFVMKGLSAEIKTGDIEETLVKWETEIKKYEVSRSVRYIITGNLLQASASSKGKLVSYTTMSGETRKGILMHENYDPKEEGDESIVVPIGRATPVIASLAIGKEIATQNNIIIARTGTGYKIMAPASRQEGGEVFLDAEILKLVHGNNFNKVSHSMVATMDADTKTLEAFLKTLQKISNDSIHVSKREYNLIREKQVETKARHKIVLLSKEEAEKEQEENLNLEIQMAEAELELELEILRLKQAA